MLDLQKLSEKSIQIIWVDGSVVSLNQPTFKAIKKIVQIDEYDIDEMEKAVLTVLNNNTSARKFKTSDIEALTMEQMLAVIREVIDFKEEVDNHPNS